MFLADPGDPSHEAPMQTLPPCSRGLEGPGKDGLEPPSNFSAAYRAPRRAHLHHRVIGRDPVGLVSKLFFFGDERQMTIPLHCLHHAHSLREGVARRAEPTLGRGHGHVPLCLRVSVTVA